MFEIPGRPETEKVSVDVGADGLLRITQKHWHIEEPSIVSMDIQSALEFARSLIKSFAGKDEKASSAGRIRAAQAVRGPRGTFIKTDGSGDAS